jgi:peptide deformylase
MFETMYAEEGIGLAATQVDIHQRIIVIDVSENREEQLVLINPEIRSSPAAPASKRAASPCPATVLWFRAPSGSRSGRKIATATPSSWKRTICSPSAYNMRWIIWSASVFVDYLSPLKRQRIRQKLEKMAREDRKVL